MLLLSTDPNQDYGFRVVLTLLAVACALSVILVFVYTTSETEMIKSFAKMQKMGQHLTIDGCVQKNMEWYESCHAITQLCDQSIMPMMRVCLVNGDKSAQCTQFGNKIFEPNFGAAECKSYDSNKRLKKACADTYQSIHDYCKAVRTSKAL